MNKRLTGGLAALLAVGTMLTAVPISAQYRDSDRDGRPDRAEWNRDRDRDGRPDQWDRHDNRWDRRDYRGSDRRDDRRWNGNQGQRWRYYGGQYGYNGYQGRWRTGQRYPYYRDRGYYVDNYRAYGLPAPRPGYRYYRSDNGDIVMAAVASGVIGLIIGGALAH